MITKKQAEAISNEVLNQQRTSQVNYKSIGVSPMCSFYNCPELRSFPSGQRTKIIRRSVAVAHRHWQTRVACFVWLAAVVATSFLLPPSQQRFTYFAQFAGGAAFALIQRKYVLRNIAELLSQVSRHNE